MEAQRVENADEAKRLRRCINDLLSVFALPAIWSGEEPQRVVRILLDVLVTMLDLDVVYCLVNGASDTAPIEFIHVAPQRPFAPQTPEFNLLLTKMLGPHPSSWSRVGCYSIGGRLLSIMPFSLGLQGEVGVILAGCRRSDFPQPTEKLLLNVAINQATVGIQEAMRIGKQRRVANELDRQITQRTADLAAANDMLRESAARKAAILNSALDCIVTIDRDGRICEFNPAAERTFGYRCEDVVGRLLAETVFPGLLHEARGQEFADLLETGRRVEMTARRSDGSKFPIEIAMARIKVAGPPSFTFYMRDIAERKRAEEELRHSEAFLAEAQRLSRVGSFSWDVAKDEISWSEELYRIFEFEPGKPVTLERIAARFYPDDRPMLMDMIEKARGKGSDFGYEHRLLMPDGSVKHVQLIAHATWDAEHRLEYIGAAQDVTKRKLAEEAIAKARSELTHVSRVTSLGVLTASIAHEVNQPLASIVMSGEAALRWLARAEPDLNEVRELARHIIDDARRASDVIDRTRAMVAKRQIEKVPLSLNDVVNRAVEFLSHELMSKRASVTLDLAQTVPNIIGDHIQLQQVVMNLAINALQAMTDNDARRRAIQVRTFRAADEMVTCMVEDSGPGLDPANLTRLFDSFFTTKDTGMGMGLPISQAIIESHGGSIRADNNSALGGARFSFDLPAIRDAK